MKTKIVLLSVLTLLVSNFAQANTIQKLMSAQCYGQPDGPHGENGFLNLERRVIPQQLEAQLQDLPLVANNIKSPSSKIEIREGYPDAESISIGAPVINRALDMNGFVALVLKKIDNGNYPNSVNTFIHFVDQAGKVTTEPMTCTLSFWPF